MKHDTYLLVRLALLLSVVAVGCATEPPATGSSVPGKSGARQLCDDNIEVLSSIAKGEDLEPYNVLACGVQCADQTNRLFASLNYRQDVPASLYSELSTLTQKYGALRDDAVRAPGGYYSNDTRYAATTMLIDVNRICSQVS